MARLKKDTNFYPFTSKKSKTGNFSDVIAKQNYGTALQALRLNSGYTLSDLSELTGFSLSYLSRLETNHRRYNIDILTKLATALGCEVHDLLKSGDQINAMEKREATYVPPKDLPVFSTSLAVKAEYPVADFSSPSKRIFRLPQLVGIKSAFAFHIIDSKNEPKYRQGDLLFVNTEKVISKNMPVVAITTNNEIMVGELLAWNDEMIELKHYNGESKKTFNKGDLHGVYSILGSFENYSI